MQSNFFITDLMSTGDCTEYERFLGDHSLPNQQNTYCNTYYALHLYNLDDYDRKFAIIDRKLNSLITAEEYKAELMRRVELLHSQGFTFILATPWESVENIAYSKNTWPKTLEGYHTIDWTGSTSWFWSLMYYKHKNNDIQVNHDNKKYDFLYLNKYPRNHRVQMFHKLEDKGVLDNSLFSFLGLDNPIRLPEEYELPWVDAKNYPQYGKDQDLYEKPYNDTRCSIISETNDNNTDVFITEKLWKPIICQHIFVVHGNHLYLQKIKEMGFKTFNSYFDESYDLEKDPDRRLDKLVDLCIELKDAFWSDIYMLSKGIRKHNYDNFFNKEKLSEEVNKTLITFLEFADSSQVSS